MVDENVRSSGGGLRARVTRQLCREDDEWRGHFAEATSVGDPRTRAVRVNVSAHPLAAPGLAGLRAWYQEIAGQTVAEFERDIARAVLPNLFGYHLVQIGDSANDLCEFSRISHRVVLGLEEVPTRIDGAISRPDALPIASNSIDVVVLPHTLEFALNPHGILREAERILIGEGHLLILGFNPWSSFGLCRRVLGWRGHAPWSGNFLGQARVRDWLGLLGFEVDRVLRASYRPPLKSLRWHQRTEFLERFGGHFWPMLSNLYAILARKRVEAARPIPASWKMRRRLSAAGAIEPTVRQAQPVLQNDEVKLT